MKKYLSFIICLLIILFSGITCYAKDSSASDFYRNEYYKFRIKFPEGWIVKDGNEPGIIRTAVNSDGATISIIIRDLYSEVYKDSKFKRKDVTFESMTDAEIDELMNRLVKGANGKVIKKDRRTLNNFKAVYAEYLIEYVRQDIKMSSYLTIKNGYIYAVTSSAFSSKYSQVESDINKSLASFAFEDSNNTTLNKVGYFIGFIFVPIIAFYIAYLIGRRIFKENKRLAQYFTVALGKIIWTIIATILLSITNASDFLLNISWSLTMSVIEVVALYLLAKNPKKWIFILVIVIYSIEFIFYLIDILLSFGNFLEISGGVRGDILQCLVLICVLIFLLQYYRQYCRTLLKNIEQSTVNEENNIIRRMEALKSLFDNGLINEDEYLKRKNEILSEL